MAREFKFLGGAVAAALAIHTGFAHAGETPGSGREAKEVQAEAARTGKERLGDKASDEQRVDNCKVPVEQRGPKPRPDTCGEGASAAAQR
jgi:hypothetical protein